MCKAIYFKQFLNQAFGENLQPHIKYMHLNSFVQIRLNE